MLFPRLCFSSAFSHFFISTRKQNDFMALKLRVVLILKRDNSYLVTILYEIGEKVFSLCKLLWVTNTDKIYLSYLNYFETETHINPSWSYAQCWKCELTRVRPSNPPSICFPMEMRFAFDKYYGVICWMTGEAKWKSYFLKLMLNNTKDWGLFWDQARLTFDISYLNIPSHARRS